MKKTKYGRVLLKLSGEALKGKGGTGIDFDTTTLIAEQIKELMKLDLQVAIVIGAGNIFRGVPASANTNIDRVPADYIGMLATIMNSIALENVLKSIGCPAVVQTSIPMNTIAEPYTNRKALQHLKDGKVLIFGGGTGSPFFTTDTTAALRASEIKADALLKATKVNGIYSEDPNKNPNATKFNNISYEECLKKRLKIMDSTAFSMCMDNNIPIVVFNFSNKKNLLNVVCGDVSAATVVGD
ncbi:MAG: UMP kinase [Verrucomicrobiota bacterium]|nr:UMP kinase [Verrucomicrobiota bacterium]